MADDDPKSLEENTIASPLMFSDIPSIPLVGNHVELLSLPHQMGYQGDILYQKLDGDAFRIKFQDLKQKSAFFWVFDSPIDARDRWFRLRYSGIYAPSQMVLSFDHDEDRNDSNFNVFLDPSKDAKAVYFKLPEREGFSKVESLRFILDPEILKEDSGDFMVLGLELLPESDNPLAGLPATDPHRFDHPLSLMAADNQASVNGGYAF